MPRIAVRPPWQRTGGPASRRAGLRGRSAAGVLACAAALAAAGATAGPAAATAVPATSTTYYWVAPTSTSMSNTSCSTAGYHTVQTAVTAAETDKSAHPKVVETIEVCPGTYSEQVTITSSLVITRGKAPANKGAAVIELPAAVGQSTSAGLSTTNCQAKDAATSTPLPQSVIEVCAAKAGGGNTSGVSVSISHVTIEGQWASNVCYNTLYGLLVGGGAAASLNDSIVQKIGGDPTTDGCQGGVAVEAGSSVTRQVGHVTMSSDTIESYQKNGITIDGPGSTGKISGVTVTGAGPTAAIAQNGIQVSLGATGSVVASTITGNNYTGAANASAAGVLVFGGGGSVCGNGKISPLVRNAIFTHNTLLNNDIGVLLFNVDSTCTKSVRTPTRDTACYNVISNYHRYSRGLASADANVAGFLTGKGKLIGDQAGISDSGNADVICYNSISGGGYAPRDKTSTLPNPAPPAWVRPIDLFSYAPPIHPSVHGNKYDGKAYKPR
jgi:hypothetical protein